jgi:uncharacterized membrane protein
MNILLPPEPLLFWLTIFCCGPVLVLALARAPWSQLFAVQERQHAFFAAALALSVLWLLQVSIKGTLAFHPLVMTVTTMLFGWNLAILVGATALVLLKLFQLAIHRAAMDADTAWAQFDLTTFPVDFCLSVAVPVGWAWCVIWLVNRWKFKNPFTYFLGVGFFGAMIGNVLTAITAVGLFTITASDIYSPLAQEYFPSFLLMTFPEGFINGTIATALTVFWPDIVKTYQDDWFLKD